MNLDVIARVAEGKIQEGIEEGKFDNLPGKGQPVNLEEDTSVPLHQRMANRVLKNAGVAPEWTQIRLDIIEERKAVVGMLQKAVRTNQLWHSRLTSRDTENPVYVAYLQWHKKSRDSYLRHLKSVNTSILKFCMTAPSTAEPFTPYNVEKEIHAYDEQVGTPDLSAIAEPTEAESSGFLRRLAQARYFGNRQSS